MLNQPANITPDEINGTGTVDVSEDVAVSWRVSGTSAMTAYQIAIYQNNAASTQLYSTGKVTLSTPFWGVNYAGTVQYFTATLDSTTINAYGVVNGAEYKMLITQWWSANDSVEQTTASIIVARDTPTLTLSAVDNPVTDKEYTFTASYAQAQGDTIKWVRWQISYADDESNPFYDTGNIYGTGELQAEYDGFLTGIQYAVKCSVETQNGAQATTGWVTFNVSYSLPVTTGAARACMVQGDSCVRVSWDREISADGYSVMRQRVGDSRLVKIANTTSTASQLRDYSAKSGQSYIYYVFPTGSLAYLTQPMVSEPIAVQYWFWSIIETVPTGNANEYSVERTYIFRYNASEGSMNNNNSPSITQNFTRYPTRQGVSANYATGTLGGYIGTISKSTMTYTDTTAQAEALWALSTSTNTLFLIDPKGNFRKIHTAGPSTLQIDHKKGVMPQTVTISWVETGPTDNVHAIMYEGGGYYPIDRIIFSQIALDADTGALLWTVPDDYSERGSTLSLNNGALIQNDDGAFVPATLAIDSDMMLTATVTE